MPLSLRKSYRKYLCPKLRFKIESNWNKYLLLSRLCMLWFPLFHNCIKLGLHSVGSIPCTVSRKRNENESRTFQVIWKLTLNIPRFLVCHAKRQRWIFWLMQNKHEAVISWFNLFFFSFYKSCLFFTSFLSGVYGWIAGYIGQQISRKIEKLPNSFTQHNKSHKSRG